MHRIDILISRPSHTPLRGYQLFNVIGILILLLIALVLAV